MEYLIADIRLSLPDPLIPSRFAEALQVFAVAEAAAANKRSGRARSAGIEVIQQSGAAGGDIVQQAGTAEVEIVQQSRATGAEVGPEEASARVRRSESKAGPQNIPNSNLSALPDLILEAATEIHREPGWHELHRFDFADADADCRFGRDNTGFLLEMSPREGSRPARFRMPEQGPCACCNFTSAHLPALFRFGVWVLFNLAALRRNTVAIHASAIRYRGCGVLFLGESGTGKSTHSRLWRENIPGTALLNDDSPVLGIADGTVRVWGSPWSGKVPCYRNESSPVAAIVRLVQAPENRIRRLAPIEAFCALFPSTPPAFIRDPRLQDALCTLLGQVIELVPVYRLACRPDADAARLACKTIFGAPSTPADPDRPCR